MHLGRNLPDMFSKGKMIWERVLEKKEIYVMPSTLGLVSITVFETLNKQNFYA
jgi:hypothetical protein